MEQGPGRPLVRSLAVAAAGLTFGFRLLTVHDLTNDHYMHLAWAQQLLFGQLPGRDFVDPGMPLMYTLSAIVQSMSPGPFSEAVLSCALMALAAAATFLIAFELSGSLAVAGVATAFEVAFEPRLYSYPKILVPAVGLLLLYQYAQQPSRRRVLYLALWTAVAVLLRHDMGLYAAAGATTAFVVLNGGSLKRALRPTAEYALALVLIMSPYVVFVQWGEGVFEHLHGAVEFAKGEAHQRFFEPPTFPFWTADGGLATWSSADAAVFLFYASHVLALGAIVLLARGRGDQSPRKPVAAAGIVMLLMYLVIILRHPIDSRVRDVGALLAIVGAWVVAEAGRQVTTAMRHGTASARIASAVQFAAIAVFTAASIVSLWMMVQVPNRVRETRVMDGIGTMERTIAGIRESGTVWPWERFWPAGEMPAAVRYLNACTTPDAPVLLTWAAPEYYFFSKRRFGAGHALFLPPAAFTTAHDQELMLARMRRERVPIVLINETRREEFATAYPRVDRYISASFTPVGRFDIRDGSTITIAIGKDFKSAGTYDAEGWPCGVDSRAASSTASTMLDASATP